MKIGDGIFRHVVVRRALSWTRSDHSAEIHVHADAEVFVEPGERPSVPSTFSAPLLSLPMYGSGFSRAQWEEIKREGDAAFADFEARFARAIK